MVGPACWAKTRGLKKSALKKALFGQTQALGFGYPQVAPSIRSLVALVLGERLLEHVIFAVLGFRRAFGRSGQNLDKEGGQLLGFELIDFGIDLFGVDALCEGLIGTDFAVKKPVILSFGQSFISLSIEVFADIVFDAVAQAIGILVFDHQGVSFSHARC